MTASDLSCTEPGRWREAPPDDASEADILAYLRHCDACPYHARLEREEEAGFDRLLREACRQIDAGDAVEARPARRRADRRSPGRRPAERAAYDRRMTYALILAFGIVVLWVVYAYHGLGAATPAAGETAAVTDAAKPAGADPGRFVGRLAEAVKRGRVYTARVISDAYDGQATRSGVVYDKNRATVAVAALPFGTRLLIVNPVNGASVEVTVVDRGPEDGRLNLSSSAARTLGFDGKMLVLVEVLSMPALPAYGP